MDRSLFTAATGMKAQQTNIDVISNNLANINTTGFKKAEAHFSTLYTQVVKAPGSQLATGQTAPSGVQVGLGVQLDATNKAFTMGSLTNTGNSLDLAIEGDGFFQIQMPNGQFAYTRDGNFQIDGQTGDVVTNRGYLVFPNINVGDDVDKIMISDDGTISVTRSGSGGTGQMDQIGEVRLARFVNPSGLIEHSDNLFFASEASGIPIDGNPMEENFGSIRQGFLEGSNVKVVEEIVNMITAQRAYEASSNVIRASDEMLRQANNIVS
jgi:flagellar basal-body rod protein FlgG